MLQHFSTKTFIEGIVLLAAIYYTGVAVLYYPKEIRNWLRKRIGIKTGDPPHGEILRIKDKV